MFERTFSFWRRLVGKTAEGSPAEAPGERDRRLWVRYGTDLHGKVQPAIPSGSSKISATIRDLSMGGANLLLDRPFKLGEMLSIEIPADGDDICTVLACVVRINPEKDERWSLGCAFSRELSSDDLSHFGAGRVEPSGADQRKWVRFACEMKASYRKVGDVSNESHATQVLNISANGIGLAVTPPLDPGTLLNVDLIDRRGQSTHTILACVVHTTQRAGGELAVGCNFIRELSEVELKALL
jgi:c-di-GMP-binding flagellar brake protein YcgR